MALCLGITAPYGKHHRQGWGIDMDARLAWFSQVKDARGLEDNIWRCLRGNVAAPSHAIERSPIDPCYLQLFFITTKPTDLQSQEIWSLVIPLGMIAHRVAFQGLDLPWTHK